MHSKGKQREKENIASKVIIEEILDIDILCVANMRITDTTLVNILLAVQDCILQTWMIGYCASFHCTRYKECFLSFSAGNFGKVYLGNNYTHNIEGLHIVQMAMGNGQELTLDQVRFVLGIK